MDECDFLVVGGGATGMAFVDSLLAHNSPKANEAAVSVFMVDKHERPGGQWNDSYSFVRLHQPSKGYGVETSSLEPQEEQQMRSNCTIPTEELHRATREEILDYYQTVRTTLEEKYKFKFLGSTVFDFSQLETATQTEEGTIYKLCRNTSSTELLPIRVKQRVVDARFLEPDLPIFVPPKFSYNPQAVQVVPLNALTTNGNGNGNNTPMTTKYYVVIGGGKTGMDAITYLLTELDIRADHIVWVVPNDVWITAREKIGSCMEFLHTCTLLLKEQQQSSSSNTEEKEIKEAIRSPELLQKAFLEWERQGKIYRVHPSDDAYPTKFKDATLSKEEMAMIQKVQNVIRKHGRVQAIGDSGELHFVDGTTVALPWNSVKDTTFVHCSAGAFNYTKQANAETKERPVFDEQLITIHDVYGTPGFCFVGSLIGKLASLTSLTDADRNAMCLAPSPTDISQVNAPLGPSGGDIGGLSKDHGYVQRLCNLRKWTTNETIGSEMKQWLVGHRLFNLGHLTGTELMNLVEETWKVLSEHGIVEG